jgi:hypothetical protein
VAICFYPVPGIGLDENASNVFEKRDYCRFRSIISINRGKCPTG